jgi:hypothetical protein
MTRRFVVLSLLASLVIGACTRSAGVSDANAKPADIYAAGPSVSDVRSLLGDSTWWPGVPQFGVRPLGLPSTPETVRFSITQHYVHVGTSETFVASYVVYSSVSNATSFMSSLQTQLGTTPTGPRAGDQVIYYGARQATKTALYETVAFTRVGQVVITADLTRGTGFADIAEMGRIANKLVSRLKDEFAGKVKPSPTPSTDANLLPPPGQDVTLVGTVRLPVEAAADMLRSSSPTDLANGFHQAGVTDFLFADYALDADLTMEVRASVFTFSSSSDASAWIDAVVGATNLDSSGVASGYSTATGQYYALFAAGSHVGVLFCDSTVQFEAAARACEAPMANLIGSWQTSLSAA